MGGEHEERVRCVEVREGGGYELCVRLSCACAIRHLPHDSGERLASEKPRAEQSVSVDATRLQPLLGGAKSVTRASVSTSSRRAERALTTL